MRRRGRRRRRVGRERAAIAELVKAARERGEDITGPDGLLKSITATVLEAALEEEMTDHLGHAKHQVPPRVVRATSATARGARRC
jgi:putative transposase